MGVQQGDTIPKLVTLALENIFKSLQWETKGIKINGAYLNHLQFPYDIVFKSRNMQELSDILKQLSDASKKVGIKMNISKPKIITNTEEQEYIDAAKI